MPSVSVNPSSAPSPSRLVRAFRRYWKYRYLRRREDYAAVLGQAAPVLTYIGYLGHHNIGDEALFEAFRDRLFTRALLLPYDDVSPLAGLVRFKVNRWAVLGGGTLINVNPYLDALERCVAQGRPFAVFGTGVADLEYWSQHPQYQRGNVERWVKVLAKAAYIGVRGPRSLRWLQEQGIQSAELIGDPALCVEAVAGGARDVSPRAQPVLGVNLGSHDPVSGGAEPTLAATAALVRHAIAKGFAVRFVPLHYIDEEAAHRLQQMLNPGEMSTLRFTGAVADTLAQIQECTVLVGQRLHATVLACALDVPTLSLSYQPKCLDFLESLHCAELAVDTQGITDSALIERFDWLCAQREPLLAKIAAARDSLRTLQRQRAAQLLAGIEAAQGARAWAEPAQ